MRKAILILGMALLLCGDAYAFDKGDVAYIPEGAWWSTNPLMLFIIDVAIEDKDNRTLARLENSSLYNVQKLPLKVVVIRVDDKRIMVKPFGVDRPLIPMWIWHRLLVEEGGKGK